MSSGAPTSRLAIAIRSSIDTCESSSGTSSWRSSGSSTLSSSSSEFARTSSSDERKPDVRVVKPDVWQEQTHQPEYPIELLIHRVVHGLQDGIVVFEAFLERPEDLIGAVMPGDLGREQQVDGRRIEGTSGCSVRSLLSDAMTRCRSVTSA